MKLKSISFENYKSFSEKQTIQIKPITILIGKNSSGKSSIAKLFPLFENSLSKKIEEPLLINNNGVELGSDFRDLVNQKDASPVSFELEFEGNRRLQLSVFKIDDTQYKLVIQRWQFNEFELTLSSSNFYVDQNGKKYTCGFKGFILDSIADEYGNPVDLEFDLNLEIDVDYIGPFRVLPQRIYNLTGQIYYSDTGIKGENAYYILGVSKRMDTDLYREVGKWYEQNFDGWELKVKDSNPYIEISLNKQTTDVNLVDVGQGMNQALPLVVRAFNKKEDSIIVLEQPELHLHPAAHGSLAELFAKSAILNRQAYILETHSENFILRLRKLIIDNEFGFTREDLIIYYVNDNQDLLEITVDADAILSDWPEGIFNEHLREILEMEKALASKSKI